MFMKRIFLISKYYTILNKLKKIIGMVTVIVHNKNNNSSFKTLLANSFYRNFFQNVIRIHIVSKFGILSYVA